MLITIYILFQVVIIGLFLASFFTHQEILSGITAILSAMMFFTSYNIEYPMYQYNATLLAYQPIIIMSYSYYLTGINLMFFLLAVILGIFDIFDKYGLTLGALLGNYKK